MASRVPAVPDWQVFESAPFCPAPALSQRRQSVRRRRQRMRRAKAKKTGPAQGAGPVLAGLDVYFFMLAAWIAVRAMVNTMSSTSAPRDRSLTGLRRPCSIGPTETTLALRCTAL